MVHELEYSQRRGPSATLIVVMALLFCGIVAVGWFISSMPGNAPGAVERPRSPDIRMFYGRVIDQNGNPVAEAEVEVVTSEMADDAGTAGPFAPVLGTQEKFTVHTNRQGYFTVILQEGYQELMIEDIIKPGYEWVVDWSWNVPWGVESDNRIYRLAGPQNIGVPYQPDRTRPAIFPMHENGNPAPGTRPSRGGSDGERMNEPVQLVIPSAGPGAPRTDEEINQRILEESSKPISRRA